MNTNTRDRAFDRIVVINQKDESRLQAILDSIPREDLIKNCGRSDGKIYFILKIKKQELLMIKLSIPVETVKKVKKPTTFRLFGKIG